MSGQRKRRKGRKEEYSKGRDGKGRGEEEIGWKEKEGRGGEGKNEEGRKKIDQKNRKKEEYSIG